MVKNLKRTILTVAIAISGSAMFAIAQSSRAQLLPKDYDKADRKLELLIGILENKTSREVLSMYVVGALEAMEWVNGEADMSRTPRIFCPPSRLVLNADNAADIIVREYTKNKRVYEDQRFQRTGRAAVSLVLLMGLKDTFPCK